MAYALASEKEPKYREKCTLVRASTATEHYRAAIAKKPDSALLFNKMGITELMIHRLKDARKDFERAIKLDKRYADAYNNLGVVYYADKNPGKAIKQYKKAIDLHADVAPVPEKRIRKSSAELQRGIAA